MMGDGGAFSLSLSQFHSQLSVYYTRVNSCLTEGRYAIILAKVKWLGWCHPWQILVIPSSFGDSQNRQKAVAS